MRLLKYSLRRAGQAVVVLLLVVVLQFLLLHLAPGDVADVIAGEAQASDPAFIAILRRELGLDQPVALQLWLHLQRVVTLDWGHAHSMDAPVWQLIAERLPGTALLMVSALLLTVIDAALASWPSVQHFLYGALLLFALYVMPGGVMGVWGAWRKRRQTPVLPQATAMTGHLQFSRGGPGALLQVQGICKAYGGVKTAQDVSFSLQRGHVHALIGPNGAGKTTTFDLIAGAQRCDSGRIVFQGQPIENLAPNAIFRRGLARTFQVPRPFAQMTVLENVLIAPLNQLGERLYANWWWAGRVSAQERALQERAREVLELCALSDKAGLLAGQLSGGQQKLLELARVLMIDPKMILLDEPAAGVNPSLLETLMERVQMLHQRGITFLLIEHNMDLVMRVCERVLVMAQGRVLAQGSPREIQDNPLVLDAYLGPST
jgi:ABC-type branched-subunit amino acid transport system ATPase component